MIVEKAMGEYTDFRIPGLVVTGRGTLLRYCECRRSRSDWAEIDIKINRSDDGGKPGSMFFSCKAEGIR